MCDIKLFYDLIHVVRIFVLGNFLGLQDPTIGTFLIFAGIFSALWFAWGELSVFNSIFISTELLAVPYIPAIVGNMLWLTALFSQGIVPYILAVKTYSTE